VFSVAQAENDFKLFTNSQEPEFKVVEGGQHFLAASNPKEVNEGTVKFVETWSRL